jgi:hypothetical protein
VFDRTAETTELLFASVDAQTDARRILNLQNVLVYATQSVEGVYA